MAEPTFKKKRLGTDKEKQEKKRIKAVAKPTTAGKKSSGANSDDTTRLSAEISVSSHRKVRMAAADQYISMTQVVDELIDRNL